MAAERKSQKTPQLFTILIHPHTGFSSDSQIGSVYIIPAFPGLIPGSVSNPDRIAMDNPFSSDNGKNGLFIIMIREHTLKITAGTCSQKGEIRRCGNLLAILIKTVQYLINRTITANSDYIADTLPLLPHE